MMERRPESDETPRAIVDAGAMGLTTPLRLAAQLPTRLPIRPRPVEQELLSSWLFRLAQGNSQKLHSLCRALFGDRSIWNRDIDRLAGNEVLTALEGATGVSIATLRQHLLSVLEGRVFAHHNAHGLTAWILPLGVYHRTRLRSGLQYCPVCLAEHPAFLLPWRLSLSVVCPLHGCLLHEVCPDCQAPVVPHRVDVAAHLSKSFPTHASHTQCFQCGTALDTAPPVTAPSQIVAWQAAVHGAIFGDEPMKVRGVGSVPLLEYLMVARLWLTLLTFGRRAERLRQLVSFPVHLTTGGGGRSFDFLDHHTRLSAVEHLIILFDGWPERVVNWSRAARLRRTILLQDMPDPPSWYLDALQPLEYINPRRSLNGPLTLDELRRRAESGHRASSILVAYGEGQSLRTIAQQYGIQPSGVRRAVTRFNK